MNVNDIPNNQRLNHELQGMLQEERQDRLRGERQWRIEIELLEREGKLPIEAPGAQPNWDQFLRAGVPDYGDISRHYAYTHYLGVVLDDEQIGALDIADLAILAQGTVTEAMLWTAMNSPRAKKQFIQVLLQTMERNNIFIPPHTTIRRVLDVFRYERADFSEALYDQVSMNKYNIYLMRYTPFAGFTSNPEATEIEYGICQGCKCMMPVKAKCTRVTNSGPRGRHDIQRCQSVGPHMECFVPQHYRKQIDLAMATMNLQPEIMSTIAKYAMKEANQYNTSHCYGTDCGIQLDESAYNQPKKVVVKNMKMLLEEHYIAHNASFSYDIFRCAYNATRYKPEDIVEAVNIWITNHLQKDEEAFSILELAYISRSATQFIADHGDEEEEEE